MTIPTKIPLNPITSGVPGLDIVLGGGIPEYSLNLIAGEAGSGKTTLANQIVFANLSRNQRAIYFNALGEPPLKMLRYQQQYSFFDQSKVGSGVRFIDLSEQMVEHDLNKVLERIAQEVQKDKPRIVIMDSFSSVVRAATLLQSGTDLLQAFIQRLSMQMATWKATTFLVGTFPDDFGEKNPSFTLVDGVIRLTQSIQRSSVVRKLQVVKVRGQENLPGLHTFRITGNGIQVYPRVMQRPAGDIRKSTTVRLKTGIPELDEMMGGGIPSGDSVLLAGPAGSGKTTLSAQFITEGLKRNEPGIVVAFEEHPQDYLKHTTNLGVDMKKSLKQNKLGVIYLRPLDLSVDETLYDLEREVLRIGAKRVVIDSLSGFEIALAPPYRDDFRESLYRLVGTLTNLGVTVFMTVEVTESFTDLHFTPHAVSFMTDDIILQRYVELDGQLRRVMTVIKMRGGRHSTDLRLYETSAKGILIGEALRGYRGIITGVPELLTDKSKLPQSRTSSVGKRKAK